MAARAAQFAQASAHQQRTARHPQGIHTGGDTANIGIALKTANRAATLPIDFKTLTNNMQSSLGQAKVILVMQVEQPERLNGT